MSPSTHLLQFVKRGPVIGRCITMWFESHDSQGGDGQGVSAGKRCDRQGIVATLVCACAIASGCASQERDRYAALAAPSHDPGVKSIASTRTVSHRIAQLPETVVRDEDPSAGADSSSDLTGEPAESIEPLPAPSSRPEEVLATDPAELTLAHLESLAMTHHPSIARRRASIEALRGKWIQAGTPRNPVLQYNSDEIGNGGFSGLHRVAVAQTMITANKLGLAQNVVAAEMQQAQADLEVTRLQVQTDVRAAFLDALVAQQRLSLVDQLKQIAEKSSKSVVQMGSESSRIELLQAQTELQRAVLAQETSQAELDGARRRLEAVVGIGALPVTPLQGTVDTNLNGLMFDRLSGETIQGSPELMRRAATIQRARHDYQLACASITPNVTAQLGVGVDAATDDTYGSVQVSVPLPLRNRNQGNLRRIRFEISEADRAYQQTEQHLASRLASVYQRYEVARRRRDRIESEIVPRAEETLKLTNQAYEVGESSFLQLLTVQRTLFEAQLQLLDATAEAAQSANLINGYLLSGSLAD